MQSALAWTTFAATIISTPHIHWAVLLGVILSGALHFARGLKLRTTEKESSWVSLKPEGLLWFASQDSFRQQLVAKAREHSGKNVEVDFANLTALDVTTIEAVAHLAKTIHPRQVRVHDSPWDSDEVVTAAIERAVAEK